MKSLFNDIPQDEKNRILEMHKTKKVFIARNSWGTNWGDKGYFYMPFDIVKPNMSSDYWIIKSVNNP